MDTAEELAALELEDLDELELELDLELEELEEELELELAELLAAALEELDAFFTNIGTNTLESPSYMAVVATSGDHCRKV